MIGPHLSAAAWRKSSHSSPEYNCIEVARDGAAHLVRDSKNPSAGTLTFDARAWKAFTAKIKQGHIDR